MIAHPREDLAAYALGALDPAEQRAVGDHIAGCEPCRADLAGYEDALWAFAETAAAPAPPGMRERIIAREIRAGGAWRRWIASAPRGLLRPVPLALPVALAVLLALALGGALAARRDADEYARAIGSLAGGRAVALAETGESPGVRGTLVLPLSGEPYLVLNLPAPPAGRTWEAWIIRGDRPLPAGTTADRAGIVTLALSRPVGVGDQIALTLEPAGGAQTPSTRPVLAGRV